ncbi:MAG: RDD family protein [Acidimicrobiia bacterium]|nr:RDD family protein [Acidimicrobiia bacterium]
MTEPKTAMPPEDSHRSLGQGGGAERKGSVTTPSDSEGEGVAPHGEGTSASQREGFGWDGLTNSVPMLLLGKTGLATVLAGFLVGYISDPDVLRNTLYLSLTPMAVLVGFGLKHFYDVVKALIGGISLKAEERPATLLVLFLFVGTIGAVFGVLAYSLIPELNVAVLSMLGGELIGRFLGGAALMWVVLAFTLLVRFPFIALVGHQLVEAMDAWKESAHWETIRKARRKDNRVVALLVAADLATMLIRGQEPIPGSWLIEVALVAFLYEAVCALGFGGTTYGKWRVGLRLAAEDGSRLSRWRAFKRSFVLYVPLFVVGMLGLEALLGAHVAVFFFPVLILYGLGYLHPDQRGFADLKTGTQVVTKAS